ncbi:MAG: hypothetical protein K6F80_01310 [Oscillospiraceae bacterium]|nr:hypothetical protein [Oscillospiraceae bacterium]
MKQISIDARRCRFLICVFCAAALPMLCGGILTHEEERRSHLPSWVILSEQEDLHTVHAVGGDEECTVHLHDGMLTLEGETFRFTTDESWFTADCFFFDADRDGFEEVLLHVWKKGSFGEHQPFWKEPDNKTLYSEHLFIYQWDVSRPDRLDPLWMSSAMPVFGRKITVEPDSTVCILAPDGTQTRWIWDGWGLRIY